MPDGYQRTADLVAASSSAAASTSPSPPIPERHPQSPTDDHDLDVLADKCRRRRRQGDDADVLRQRPLPPLPRPGRGARHRHPDRAGHLPDPLVPRSRPVRRTMRRVDPGTDRRPFAGLDDDARATHNDRHRARRDTDRRARRARRRRRCTSTRSTAPTSRSPCANSSASVDGWSPHEHRRLHCERPRPDRILVLDGATGTEFQALRTSEDDLRGDRFTDHPSSLAGQPRPAGADPTRLGHRAAPVVPAGRRRHHHHQHVLQHHGRASANTASTIRR